MKDHGMNKRISSAPLDKKKITEALAEGADRNAYINMPIIIYNSVASTNLCAKEYTEANPGTDALFLAEEQTAGRGRLDRRFHSPAGAGLYMTMLMHPRSKEQSGVWLTVSCAVAVCRAIERICPITPEIKWVNDIYVGNRKLCGILASGKAMPCGSYEYALCGIGINVSDVPMPEDISYLATSIERECGTAVDRNRLAAAITCEMYSTLSEDRQSVIDEYRRRSMLIGKSVRVFKPNSEYSALVKDISDSGELVLLLESGNTELLATGEVSVRQMQTDKN